MSDGYGLLKGKKGIIFGALDERSIAWRIALACKREGAEFVLSNAPIALRLGTLNALSEECNAPIIPCDVTNDDEIKELVAKTKEHFNGGVDFILHAIGMSPNVRKGKEYSDLNYNWMHQSLDISAISLHRILQHADQGGILNDGGSIVALSYIGAQRIFSKYSDMNDAKALLESIARNYGSRLAPRGIRVNTISQAPTKTSAGTGIRGFDGMYTFADKIAPMGNPTADECADYTVTLFSDLTRKVTMQNLYHDGGFVTSGINEQMILDLAKVYAEEEGEE